MSLEGKMALVTGASRGLGLATARALAQQGARVACLARAGAELDAAVGSLTAAGARAIAVAADLTREAEVEAAVARAVAFGGGLDIAVLNAGTWQGGSVVDTPEATWDLLLDLNLKGAFLALKHAAPRMIARGGGTIVGIDSIGGLAGSGGSAAYSASKFGLRGLLESAALELRRSKVRVSILYPHNINSGKRPIADDSSERFQNLEPEDIASLVAFICSAPPHVAIGSATIWPLNAGIGVSMV